MNPSVLIVNPNAFSMGWRGATSRVMDLAEGLTRHGWGVSMLTRRQSLSVDLSPFDIAFRGRVIRTPFSGAYAPWMDTHDVLRRANRALWKMRGREHYLRAIQYGWALRTAQWARKHWPPDRTPDVVWTVSSSTLTGAFAGRYLSRIFSRPMVMELHDPPLYPGSRLPRSVVQRGFERCVRDSAAIVTTTESYADYLRQEYNLPADKVVPVHLSYRGQLKQPTPRKDSDKLILLHAGSLTTSRGKNAGFLLRALAAAFQKNPSCRGGIRLRLLGGGEGTAEFKSLAERLGLSDSLECLDEVPYDQFKKELDAANVLLVVKYVEEKYDMQIPGKLFEYLGTGKPILGLMRRSAEAAKILERSGLGLVPESGQSEALGQCMLQLWDNRNRLHEAYRPDVDYVEQFSSEAMASRVDALLNRVVAESRAT